MVNYNDDYAKGYGDGWCDGYYHAHIDRLPSQEKKVFVALLCSHKPLTSKEVSEQTILTSNLCSAYLCRLVRRGMIKVASRQGRTKFYAIKENSHGTR